jgi:hypothetical protein
MALLPKRRITGGETKVPNTPLGTSVGENTDIIDKRLKNLRPPWKKGECPNPGGRPKRRLTQALVRLLEMSPSRRNKYQPKDGFEQTAMGLIDSATRGDGKFKQRSHAQSLIFDRIEGKPEPSDREADALHKSRTIIFDMPMPPNREPLTKGGTSEERKDISQERRQ